MTTKQQLRQMQNSGLNAQDQWSLLNSNIPLVTLNEHNHVQTQSESAALAKRVAASLVNTSAQATAAKAQAAVGKPTNSTPLQNGSLRQNMDLKQQFVKNIGSASASVGAAAAPAGTSNAPAGIKPIVNDSRDAMEQKKDESWDKIESTYHPRDAMDRKKDEMWGQVNGSPLDYPVNPSATPLPQPGATPFQTPNPYQDVDPTIYPDPQPRPYPPGVIPTIETYDWYSSYEDAAQAWAKENVSLSKDLERCAMIYKNIDKNGNERYTFTDSYYGMDEIPFLGIRPNVVIPFAWLRYLDSGIPESDIVGFIHSHPEPPSGSSYSGPSNEDLSLYKYGINQVTVVPYETGIPTTYPLKPSK